jgi:hypothetical protein
MRAETARGGAWRFRIYREIGRTGRRRGRKNLVFGGTPANPKDLPVLPISL